MLRKMVLEKVQIFL